MILNTAIFTATIEAARVAAAARPEVLRAIDRAVVEIEKAAYWSFADGVLTIKSTTSGEMYKVDTAHTCPARSKVCKHFIARLLMIRYHERLANAEPVPAVVVRESQRGGYWVATPYKHEQFVKALKITLTTRAWNESKQAWFIPADKLAWVTELIEYWFKQPVVVEKAAPVAPADERADAIARINAAWEGQGYTVGRALFRRFGVNQLDMLPDQTLKQIAAAIR